MNHSRPHHRNHGRAAPPQERPILITGGAGFIGTNVAEAFIRRGRRVVLLDNLSRPGVEENARWLCRQYPEHARLLVADVRDAAAVHDAVQSASAILHFAAQVAVTSSLTDPRHDFEVNLLGTLNVLEAARARRQPPPLLFTSTNKVYGDLHGLAVEEHATRYCPTHYGVRTHGFAEGWLDFHSPYGCSKGAADQYVLDYARSFGMPTVVFRMSCIYGPHQWGTEDQGWVAHFLLRALAGEPITIYGDGKQVRDVLYVEDLARAMLLALEHIEQTRGRAFNVGGGPANAVSLLEMMDILADVTGAPVTTAHGPWRCGDQRYYVSDTGALRAITGWEPKVGVEDGVRRLGDWLRRHRTPAHAEVATP